MELLTQSETWISLATLTAMEIVLGIDNVVFLAIVSSRLPEAKQASARRIGLIGAMVTRLGLLFAISWIMGLTGVLFTVFGEEISGRDLILLGGGLFLIAKATHEIHAKLEEANEAGGDPKPTTNSMTMVIAQIMVIDIVFSLDSVITAVGMADHLSIMATAMVLAVIVMLVFAGRVAHFVDENPTVKILALSFLILIGVMLTAEGLGQHIGKGYIYFAMAFSLGVELVNMRVRKKRGHVRLSTGTENIPKAT